MQASPTPQPTRHTVGFFILTRAERRMVNRQRLLRNAGLLGKELAEAFRWIASARWGWLADRRARILEHTHAA